MANFTITRKLDLPSDQVWAIVSDFTRPPSPAISIKVEEKGNPEANGVGAIRNINIIGWIVVMVIRKAINRFIDAIEEGHR